MGTITLNINDKSEQKFRKAARITFGASKGSLGKAATSALEQWADRRISGNEAKMLELLETGFNLGGSKAKAREELHER